jgi:hypothetical protein
MFQADLAAAGIPVRDDAGLVADFQSLRHTFITNLANAGVHPKTAQTLARRCTITLTMDRYSHTLREQEAEALAVLPDLSGPRKEALAATGTDGKQSVLASCLALSDESARTLADFSGLKSEMAASEKAARKTGKAAQIPDNSSTGSVCTSGGALVFKTSVLILQTLQPQKLATIPQKTWRSAWRSWLRNRLIWRSSWSVGIPFRASDQVAVRPPPTRCPRWSPGRCHQAGRTARVAHPSTAGYGSASAASPRQGQAPRQPAVASHRPGHRPTPRLQSGRKRAERLHLRYACGT